MSGPQIVPHSKEAEEALLGGCLINPSAIEGIMLDPDEFYIIRNGWIWEAFLALRTQGLPIDLVTVTEELEKVGHLAEIGGSAYLTKIINNVPSSLHVEAYAKSVKETAVRRKMILEANGLVKSAYDETKPVEESIQEHVENVGELRLGTTGKMKSVVDVHLDFATNVFDEGIALPYNIGNMDAVMGGKERGTLIVVAARPGMGKSTFALQSACNDARNGYKAGIFELEMTAEGLWQRRVCPRVGISWRDVRAGEIIDEQKQALVDASIDLSIDYKTLFIDDTPALTSDDIYLKALENELDIVYIDHLWLMGDPGDSEVKRLGDIAMRLKNMAKKLKIPVVVLSQLNRNLERRKDKRPQLADLRESGKIEEAADDVLMMYRDDYYTNSGDDTTEIWVRKFRNGDGSAMIKLKFDSEQQWFDSPHKTGGYEPAAWNTGQAEER